MQLTRLIRRLKKLVSAIKDGPQNKLPGRRCIRPRVEQLEDRTMPAIIVTGVPTWVDQGPAPEIRSGSEVGLENPVAGAIQSIAVNPNDTSEIIVGTVSGGVWRTTNADPNNPGAITWTVLTDQLESLSFGAVAYDPGDVTGNTFYAGTGVFTNSFNSGGPAIGLYRTTDAGATWELLGRDELTGHRIKSIVVTGDTILVGTIDGSGIVQFEQRDYRLLGGGLFRSTDGGASFTQVQLADGLPAGAVPSLLLDPNNNQRVFAAIPGEGVFRSEDAGETWAPVNTGLTDLAGASDIELTAQNIAAATRLFVSVSTGDTLNGVFTSTDDGDNWALLPGALPTPFSAGGGNFSENVQLVADPVNAEVVYIDGQGGGERIYRYDPATDVWVLIHGAGTDGVTEPHPDSRDLQFLGTDVLLEVDDGGIYLLPDPTDAANRDWESFNGNIGAIEFYQVAYDSTNEVLFGGTQDNGSPHQSATGSFTWTDLVGGDGQFQQADATSLGGDVLRYSLSNNFSFFERNRFNASNVNVNRTSGFITGATNPGTIRITSNGHGLLDNDQVLVFGVLGNTAANGFFTVDVINANEFDLLTSAGNGTYLGGGEWQRFGRITDAQGTGGAGTPVAITSAGHRLSTGDQVTFQQVNNGNAFLNGNSYYITFIDADHFSVDGTSAGAVASTTGFWSLSNSVLLKTAIGDTDLSGLNAADAAANFFDFMPYVLNVIDPRLMLLGYTGVYEDADTTAANGFAGDVITEITTDVGTLFGTVSALAYGGRRAGSDFTNVAFVGTRGGQLFFRGEAGTAFTDISDGGFGELFTTNDILSIALDPQDWRRAYVLTEDELWFTPNVEALGTLGNEFRVIGGAVDDNLDELTEQFRSLALVDTTAGVAGDSTPVVGALGGVFRMLPLLAGACPGSFWSEYGQGLPNAVVRDVRYDATDDVLIAGTFGRGAWTVADVSLTINVHAELIVTGNGAANAMRLEDDPNNPIRIRVDDGLGNVESFEKTLFSRIFFDAQGGADVIHIEGDEIVCGVVPFFIDVDGGAGLDRLEVFGPDDGSTWIVNAANKGDVNSLIHYVSAESLTGGDDRDVFRFLNGGREDGTVNGGGGRDWLDYSFRTSSVVVNLTTGQATRTGGVNGIENVLGSAVGGDTLTGGPAGGVLVGHGKGNKLKAGTGRGILIGGFGKNLLQGGPADDLLIAGKTSFDNSVNALDAMFAAWNENVSYKQRIANLRNGNGPADGVKLILGQTVFVQPSNGIIGPRFGRGGAALYSTLVGNGGLDWFFTAVATAITDRKAGEQVN